MNSCLQCVSNLPPIVKYFLSGTHTREINEGSPTKGALATYALYERLVIAIKSLTSVSSWHQCWKQSLWRAHP
jgi:hypothetical protein